MPSAPSTPFLCAALSLLKPRPSLEGYPAAIQEFYRLNHLASQEFASPQEVERRTSFMTEHLFRPAVSLCIDGRVQDFMSAMGVPIGVTEIYRSAGATHSPENLMHMRRISDAVQSVSSFQRADGVCDPRVTMLFQTVHYSHSFPAQASCAAWNHDTPAALARMWALSEAYNDSWPGQIIAFPVLIDTDLDALTVVGPAGRRFGVRELLDPLHEADSLSAFLPSLMERMRALFPVSWPPLGALDSRFQEAFHRELAECLLRNLDFVRNICRSGREPEMLDHQERLVFLGRHADWITDHNSVFLIDDTTSREEIAFQVKIALRYVAKNILLEALPRHERDWGIPFVVNVPHIGADERATKTYIRALVERVVKPAIHQAVPDVRSWLMGEHGIPRALQAERMLVDLRSLEERIHLCTSVSHKATRQFIPFT